MDVVNRGLSGYNTSQALEILPRIIPPPSDGRIVYLILLFGANDAALPDTTGQHIPLQEYKENIMALLTHPLITAHCPRLILVTPPPIDEVQCEVGDIAKGGLLARRADITAEYASAAREIGIHFDGNLVVVDMWRAIMEEALKHTKNAPKDVLLGSKALGRSDSLVHLLPDGLHLSAAGYAIFFREILSAIEQKWPDTVSPSEPSDTFVFPYWAKAPKLERF
jgi:lysophospholipase L1-like esterase